jgi:FkbM family methyltransferase
MRPYYYLGSGRALTQLSEGYPFFVNTRDAGITTWIILGGTWENFVDDILCGITKAGDRVLDAGANMGYYSVKLGYRVGPSGRVVAFEPNPEIFPFLSENVAINGLSGRVEIHNVALADQPGQATLTFGYANMGGGSLVDRPASDDERRTVDVVRGDDLLGDSSFDVMKFDVEGFEPLAAAGLEKTLARSSGAAIIVEVSAPAWRRYGDFAEILGRFSRGRRKAFEIAHDGYLEPVDLSHKSEIDVLAARNEPVYFLLIPPEHWAMNFVMSKCRLPAHTPMAMV